MPRLSLLTLLVLVVVLFAGSLHAQTRPNFEGFRSWMMDIRYVAAEGPVALTMAINGRLSATQDHIAHVTHVDDTERELAVTFNSTGCTTRCWRGSSCPRDPKKGCSVEVLNLFFLFAESKYGGPCSVGSWWNVTDADAPSLRESACFSNDGKVPHYFDFVDSDDPEDSYVVKISNFVSGPPPPEVFKIPSSCPCSGTTA